MQSYTRHVVTEDVKEVPAGITDGISDLGVRLE